MLSELDNVDCMDIGLLINEIAKRGDINNITDETIMEIIEEHVAYQKALKRMFKPH
jgi:hypothetical protein